eukprot:10642279-Alexandrium_andersonii.AAC.1
MGALHDCSRHSTHDITGCVTKLRRRGASATTCAGPVCAAYVSARAARVHVHCVPLKLSQRRSASERCSGGLPLGAG